MFVWLIPCAIERGVKPIERFTRVPAVARYSRIKLKQLNHKFQLFICGQLWTTVRTSVIPTIYGWIHELWAEPPPKFISMKLNSTARLLTSVWQLIQGECVIFSENIFFRRPIVLSVAAPFHSMLSKILFENNLIPLHCVQQKNVWFGTMSQRCVKWMDFYVKIEIIDSFVPVFSFRI